MESLMNKIIDKVSEFVVGHKELMKLMYIALVTDGHILLEGPAGVGKTHTAKLFAQSIGGKFKRIQMVPDMLPSDILGSSYYDMSKSKWLFRPGPIFANVVLVDELNRAPPRTQSAFLEAMQELQVTVEGNTLTLPQPFMVLATQMPVGTEGTYPLTPVQLDRFSYYYPVDYPKFDEELEIISRIDYIESAKVDPIVSLEEISKVKSEVTKTYVSEKVKEYVINLVNFIRAQDEVIVGPSPRASIWLLKGSRALAYINNERFVTPDHVKYLAKYVLLHRIRIKSEYEVDGVKPNDIVNKALSSVEVPKI
jgi:MoxR-like ATPase